VEKEKEEKKLEKEKLEGEILKKGALSKSLDGTIKTKERKIGELGKEIEGKEKARKELEELVGKNDGMLKELKENEDEVGRLIRKEEEKEKEIEEFGRKLKYDKWLVWYEREIEFKKDELRNRLKRAIKELKEKEEELSGLEEKYRTQEGMHICKECNRVYDRYKESGKCPVCGCLSAWI
jgi:rubrerythrin